MIPRLFELPPDPDLLRTAFVEGASGRIRRAKFVDDGTVFISVREADKQAAVHLARELSRLGYRIVATHGTRKALLAGGVDAELVHKISAGRPNVLDLLTDKRIDLIVNTPSGRGPRTDEGRIRAAAVQHGVPSITTLSGAAAAIKAIQRIRARGFDVKALQDYFPAPARV